MDIFSKEKRSDVMSKIRGRGNKDTELVMIQIFKEFHITGWRRNQNLLGKPDFTFWQQRVIVFVDGCFWHGCPLHSTMPKTNKEFWESKLTKNKVRDQYVSEQLVKKHWRVIRIWEHELRDHTSVALLIRTALDEQ
jgi:DNA mismatch endonuclease (patch repair protein)